MLFKISKSDQWLKSYVTKWKCSPILFLFKLVGPDMCTQVYTYICHWRYIYTECLFPVPLSAILAKYSAILVIFLYLAGAILCRSLRQTGKHVVLTILPLVHPLPYYPNTATHCTLSFIHFEAEKLIWKHFYLKH